MSLAMKAGTAILLSMVCSTVTAQQPASSEWHSVVGVARVFQQACVLNNNSDSSVADWALSQGFEPAEALRGSMDGLLSGQAGSVLAAPGTQGRVLLVAAPGRQCTVWAERLSGPSLRGAVAAALEALHGKNGRLKLEIDRNFERAGAWRNQMQWRYRAAGAGVEMGLGAITTLADGQGTQALHAAPLPNTPAYAPDGLPQKR